MKLLILITVSSLVMFACTKKAEDVNKTSNTTPVQTQSTSVTK